MRTALWLLIGLQVRGWLRFGLRSLATPKGAMLVILGLLVFLPSVSLQFWRSGDTRGMDPTYLRSIGPPALAGYCLLNLLLTGGENALYFAPAEVSFLFPAPLSRRQLVGYKLISTALVGLPTALLMTVLVYPYAGSFLSAFLSIGLIMTFIQLFGIALQLLVAAIGAQLFRRGKRLALLLLTLAAVAGVGLARWHGGPNIVVTMLAGIPETTPWRIAMQPFAWFVEVCLARTAWPDLALFFSLSCLVNLVFLALVFTLDTVSLESLAASSARLYVRIQRLRGQPAAGEVDEEHGYLPALPPLPWLGGIGPLLWRQMTTALRQPARLALAALPFGFLLVGPLLATPEESARAVQTIPLLVVGALWVSLFLTALVPYDFRGDVDRMAVLKTLPLPGWRLVLGELAAPVLLVSAMQGVVLVVLHFVLPPPEETARLVACFVVPFNFLLFAQENLLFLLFPIRVMAANPGDFQAVGKNILVLVARLFGLCLAVGGAGAAGALAFFLLGRSWGAALLAAWLVLAGLGAALVPVVALAFAAFDISRDAPA